MGEDSAFCRWSLEEGEKISWKRYNKTSMSPVSPVFHTVKTVRIVLKFNLSIKLTLDYKMSMLDGGALKISLS